LRFLCFFAFFGGFLRFFVNFSIFLNFFGFFWKFSYSQVIQKLSTSYPPRNFLKNFQKKSRNFLSDAGTDFDYPQVIQKLSTMKKISRFCENFSRNFYRTLARILFSTTYPENEK